MELAKIRNLSDDELKSEQAKAGEQLFRIRFQKSLGNLEGVKKLRDLKTDIARLKTITRERQLAAGPPVTVKGVAPAPSQRTARKKAKKD